MSKNSSLQVPKSKYGIARLFQHSPVASDGIKFKFNGSGRLLHRILKRKMNWRVQCQTEKRLNQFTLDL
jgi:hypothetical protein